MFPDQAFQVARRYPGGTVFVVAGGPSVARQNVKGLAGRPLIAINFSYADYGGMADFIYCQDARFLRRHRPMLERFKGKVVTTSKAVDWPGLLRCKAKNPPGLALRAHELTARRTSLAGGINIAAHMVGEGGTIVLLGADGGFDGEGRAHHHQAHPWPVKPGCWEGQRQELATLKPDLERLGIRVVNCSPGSHWRDLWPIMSLDDFLRAEAMHNTSDPDERRAALEKRYFDAFDAEAARLYPMIDAFEQTLHYRMPRERLLQMASELACPLKENPPNWQHGRIIYALARRRAGIAAMLGEVPTFLDIGTAKGFSALCFLWALVDQVAPGNVISTDVVKPDERVARNSVAEIDGLKTLREFVAPHMPAAMLGARLDFFSLPGMHVFKHCPPRIAGAFVDGKHKYTDVLTEAEGIAARQLAGDFILFDDVQLIPVGQAVDMFRKRAAAIYSFELVDLAPVAHRRYMLAMRQ